MRCDVRDLPDIELKELLVRNGCNPGPITNTTREVYVKKLQRLLSSKHGSPMKQPQEQKGELTPNRRNVTSEGVWSNFLEESTPVRACSNDEGSRVQGVVSRDLPLKSEEANDYSCTGTSMPYKRAGLPVPNIKSPGKVNAGFSVRPDSGMQKVGEAFAASSYPPPTHGFSVSTPSTHSLNRSHMYHHEDVKTSRELFSYMKGMFSRVWKMLWPYSKTLDPYQEYLLDRRRRREALLESYVQPRSQRYYQYVKSVIMGLMRGWVKVILLSLLCVSVVYPMVFHLTKSLDSAWAFNLLKIGTFCVIALVSTCFFGIGIFRHYMRERKIRSAEVFKLVDAVIEFIQRQRNAYENGRVDSPYFPILHLRDVLIEPSERKKKEKVWRDVVAFIKANESRIRTEVQRHTGQEVYVWKWIGESCSNNCASKEKCQKERLIMQAGGIKCGAGNSSSTSSFDFGSKHKSGVGAATSKVFTVTSADATSSSRDSATNCLKIHLIGSLGSKHQKDIMLSLAQKIKDLGAKILHYGIPSSGTAQAIYVKVSSNSHSVLVYQKLDNTYLEGLLVRVKFMREDKYQRLFPELQLS